MSATALGVFLIYVLGIVLAFTRQPIFALYSYLWIFYNDPQTSWWGTDLPPLRYSLVAALAALVAAARLGDKPSMPWTRFGATKILIAFTVWIWLESFWAVNPTVHFDGVILCTKYLILAYVVYRLTPTVQSVQMFLWAHLAGCFLFGWKAFNSDVSGRLESIGAPGVDDANLLAAHMVTGLLIAGIFFVGLRGWKRWAAFATLPFILNGIILTQSRGGFLALIAGGGAAWYLAPRKHKAWVAVAGVLGGLLLIMLSNESFWERIDTIFAKNGEQTEETRVQIIGPQFNMFRDHPLGAGYRGNAILSPKYMAPELLSNAGIRSAHNTFMAALVDQGFVGAVLLVGLYGWAFFTLRRLKRLDKEGLPEELALLRAAIGSALASCFVSGLFLNMLTSEVQIWLIALLSSLMMLCKAAVEQYQAAHPKRIHASAVKRRAVAGPPATQPKADVSKGTAS